MNFTAAMLNRAILLGSVIAFAGLAAIIAGFWMGRTDSEMKDWPVVLGKLKTAQLEKASQARLYVPSVRANPPAEPMYRYDTVWLLVVEYAYDVEGQTFSGTRPTSTLLFDPVVDMASQPGEQLRALLAKLQQDSTVQVHYRKADPSESYLIYTGNPQVTRAYLLGACFSAIGFAMTVAAILLRRR